jgi:hypothetical protein
MSKTSASKRMWNTYLALPMAAGPGLPRAAPSVYRMIVIV